MHFTNRITVEQTQQLSSVTVFDCRHDLARAHWGRKQYAADHIHGGYFVDLDHHLSGPKSGQNGRHPLPLRSDLLLWLASHGVQQHQQVVCYDQLDGMFAARLWWLCRWAGLTHVAVLEGGYAAWLAKGGSTASVQTSQPAAAPVLDLPALEQVVSVEEVLSNLSQAQFAVVDARAPERYRGEVEPLDAVAGHIPGALNHPFKRNVDAYGAFVNDVAAQWRATHELANGLPLVHQCGSGVTACHNILAHHVAGLTQAHESSRLYAGSWSEWCCDATRPVSVG